MKFNSKEEVFYTIPRLVKLIKKYSSGKNLDVGCGTGAYFPYFKGSEIYGVDLSSSYLNSIDKRKFSEKKIILKKADIRNLPFKRDTFDFVISSLVLEYMKTQKELNRAVFELKRVLKKDGVLVITTPHSSPFTVFVRRKIISRIFPKERKDPNFVMGVTRSRKDLEKLGFKTRGCLGWMIDRALNGKILTEVLDSVLWNFPFFSGTLIGIYRK